MARHNLTRRQLLQSSAFLGCAATLPFSWHAQKENQPGQSQPGNAPSTLAPPATGKIPVAFAISDGAVVIDFCGPWEVFQDASPMDGKSGFHLYTIAEKDAPVETSGGMKILPNYTFENAPQPKIIVIPAQNGDNEAMYRWIRESSKAADVTMSVCTGAFVLAKTGLLSGKSATTHHYAYTDLAMQYPDIHVKRGFRFVEEGKIATAGGLTSGMDLALRVVERYYGRDQAMRTALNMEYQGQGWLDATGASNAIYAQVQSTTNLTCPICGMDIDEKSAPTSIYKGHTYHFCSNDHKAVFDASPEKALQMTAASK
ncbi:MAG TPA: DJ-1/PfpI family protein [Candidatus Dormibacteraeota bacterium]|nr:DJ-1/PfpI family protein [Candidatus Dormibacteraeota bacterium]